MHACLENVYLEVEIEEEGAVPLHFQGESRCDLENLNIAWFLNSTPGEFLVSIVHPVVLKLRPEALYAFLYPVRTRQGPNRL